MAGNGTIGLEILEDLPEPDTVVVPYGGGGLATGIASALKARSPRTRIFAVEPETGAALNGALAAGEPTDVEYRALVGRRVGQPPRPRRCGRACASSSTARSRIARRDRRGRATAGRADARRRRGRGRAGPRRGAGGQRGDREGGVRRVRREHRPEQLSRTLDGPILPAERLERAIRVSAAASRSTSSAVL